MVVMGSFDQSNFHITDKPKVNAAGIFGVYFYVGGLKTLIVVDDYFPCNEKTGDPIFAHSESAEIWVMVLEKAWAKLLGTY